MLEVKPRKQVKIMKSQFSASLFPTLSNVNVSKKKLLTVNRKRYGTGIRKTELDFI